MMVMIMAMILIYGDYDDGDAVKLHVGDLLLCYGPGLY